MRYWNLGYECDLVLSWELTRSRHQEMRCRMRRPTIGVWAQESNGSKSGERMKQPKSVWALLIRTGPGCFLIALITFVCYRLQLNLTVTGFIYLIAIVLQSLMGNFISSRVVCVVAGLCLDFFFPPPRFSLEVTSPLDILALISFLTTGLVVSRLTTRVREEAAISDHQRRQVDRLYQLAQMLLAVDPGKTTCATSIELFRNVFDLRSVCLFDAIKAEIYCTDTIPSSLADQTRDACASGRDSENAGSGVLTRCYMLGGKRSAQSVSKVYATRNYRQELSPRSP